MIYELDPTFPGFPNPEEAEPDGLIAIGGDLSPERLIQAYINGIFPWYSEGEPLLWWSLDPRMVLFPDEFLCSKSLRRVVNSHKFEVRIDTAFEQVMRGCANALREGQEGTWITEEMVSAYMRLHQLGFAHSFETYFQGRLVGGLYGVSLGRFFFGESMFHTVTDASKVAFVRLVQFAQEHHFRLIDAQQETLHLASLGARPIPRRQFLSLLATLDPATTLRGRWK
ncbi:MAG: leucyl/phenylalanyl-tRNA--protein transferase [Bacteroidales bacterium]|nr:leucyl/phenylalanyl-tRNA--protein transferase [Bacteroidales bacterium]